jgi:hypothetical protein
MWTKRNDRKPEYAGHYTCFGTLHKGDVHHEIRTSFEAYWNGLKFVDRDGEDLAYINESVEYWLDLSKIPTPDFYKLDRLAVKPITPVEVKVEREQIRAVSFGSWLMANKNSDEYSYSDFENIGQIVQDYEEYLNWCEEHKKGSPTQ